MGCVTEMPQTTVIRLGFRSGLATTRIMEGEKVAELTRDPLLRSADSLRALFAEAAVICEADSDRAFYDEINSRLLETPDRQGSQDTMFLNAQNWQTIPVMAAPLREAGIPAAVILDLDVLLRDEHWPKFWKLCGLSPAEKERLSATRVQVAEKMRDPGRVAGDSSPWRIKVGGTSVLPPKDKPHVDEFLAELAAVGIFVVEVGELENWLPQFKHTNKQTWVTDMLVSLGTAGTGAYVAPGQGDVWSFIERVAAWTSDPERRGIPG